MPKKKKGKGDDDGTFEVESFDGDKLDEVISSAGTLNPAALGGLGVCAPSRSQLQPGAIAEQAAAHGRASESG